MSQNQKSLLASDIDMEDTVIPTRLMEIIDRIRSENPHYNQEEIDGAFAKIVDRDQTLIDLVEQFVNSRCIDITLDEMAQSKSEINKTDLLN